MEFRLATSEVQSEKEMKGENETSTRTHKSSRHISVRIQCVSFSAFSENNGSVRLNENSLSDDNSRASERVRHQCQTITRSRSESHFYGGPQQTEPKSAQRKKRRM